METIMNKSPIFVQKGVIMETMELKSDLVGMIESIEDNKVLNAIYILLTRQFKVKTKADFWDELPDEVKNDID